jgi:hypothetical protein
MDAAMDPFDEILSMLVNKLIVMLRDAHNAKSPKKT